MSWIRFTLIALLAAFGAYLHSSGSPGAAYLALCGVILNSADAICYAVKESK